MEATSPARDGTVVASQLTYQPNSDRMFLKPLSPTFNFVVTVVLSSDERLSFSADEKFDINNLQTENTQNSSSINAKKRLLFIALLTINLFS